jgi:hypothetical protein
MIDHHYVRNPLARIFDVRNLDGVHDLLFVDSLADRACRGLRPPTKAACDAGGATLLSSETQRDLAIQYDNPSEQLMRAQFAQLKYEAF